MFHGFIFSNVFVAPEIAADTGILASKSLKIIGTLGKHALQKLGQQMRFCNTEEPFPKFRVAIIPTCFLSGETFVYTCLHYVFLVFSDPTQHVGRMIYPGVSSHFR